MSSVSAYIAPISTTTTAIVECPECGGEMHSSMSVCGDCMNEGSFFVARGQRVLTSTRRSFQHGY